MQANSFKRILELKQEQSRLTELLAEIERELDVLEEEALSQKINKRIKEEEE